MNGVIFQDVNFWLKVHEVFGTAEQGKKLTQQYLHRNYQKLVEEIMKLWKGKEATPYFKLIASLQYMPGVRGVFAFIKKEGFVTAIISASSLDAARRVQQEFGVDHIYANELVIRNNCVTGDFIWPIGAGKHTKAEIIRHLCTDLGISTKETIYIGDDEIDVEAFQEVGLSIAFNSTSEKLKKVATYIVEGNDLSKVLPYLR